METTEIIVKVFLPAVSIIVGGVIGGYIGWYLIPVKRNKR